MKKILIIALLLIPFLFPNKSLAVECRYSDMSETNCPVCPPGYQYADWVNTGIGGCTCVDTNICTAASSLTANQCSALISCSAAGATGYSCILHSVGQYTSGVYPNGCCNGTQCFITSEGPSDPIPPPDPGGGGDCAASCGSDMLNYRGTCPSGYLCIPSDIVNCASAPGTGNCTANTTGICTGDDDCGGGTICAGSRCQPPSPVPTRASPWGRPGEGPGINEIGSLFGSSSPINAPIRDWKLIAGVGISIFMLIAIILSLIYLVWGGFDWIVSSGEKQGIQKARDKIFFAIIGLIVVFIAYLIVNVVSAFFKIG